MNALAGRHWIGGAWRDLDGAATFELRQRIAPFEPLGAWPRATAAMLSDALAESESAVTAWSDWTDPERRRCVRRAVDALRADSTWSDHLERYLGLTADELAPERAALDVVAEDLGSPVEVGGGETRATIVLARWNDLVAQLARRVAVPLLAGRAAVIVTDERWPVGPEVLGQTLDAAGVPAGLASILHGLDTPTRAALRKGTEVAVERADGARPPYAVELGARRADRSYVVQRDDDLARAAADVVRRSFGRSETLSGQMPGRVGRVLCHTRVFSGFSEELLRAIEASTDVQDPVPMVDGRSLGALRALWELGLDEGATMIFGGEPFTGSGSKRSNDRRAWPTVFTNVEAGMSIARLEEAAPVLSLIRTDSDAASQKLARSLG